MASESRGGGALTAAMSSLNAALAQLVVLEAAQVAELEKTRAAIAAIETIARATEDPPTEAPVPGKRVASRPAPAAHQPAAAPSRSETPAMVKGHQGAAAAAARATTILRLIAAGRRGVADIRAALPVPAGATALQHRQSIANALTRLKGDGYLVNRADGWALTVKGRTRAAKEEP